ncbi:MAG: putative DNA ligase 1, partial [Streblomastix strix]
MDKAPSKSKKGAAVAGSKGQENGYIKDPTKLYSCEQGEDISFLELARAVDETETESKRLQNIQTLSNFLRVVIIKSPDSLTDVLYLCSDMISPNYEGDKLGVSDEILKECIVQFTGMKKPDIVKRLKDLGDLGAIAMEKKSTQKTLVKAKPLTCKNVLEGFRLLSTKSERNQKIGIIMNMMSSCTGVEVKFLFRRLQGKLRSHLGFKTLLSALAHASVINPPDGSVPIQFNLSEARNLVEHAWEMRGNLDMIVAALRKGGIRNLETECNFAVGLPIQAMLAKPCNSATQVLARMRTFGNRFTCEYKYDGLRAQFHFPLGSISNETSSSSSQSSSSQSSSQSSSSQSSSSSSQSSSSQSSSSLKTQRLCSKGKFIIDLPPIARRSKQTMQTCTLTSFTDA